MTVTTAFLYLLLGGAGPWAVAGYRMGEAELERLGLKRGSLSSPSWVRRLREWRALGPA